MARLLSSPPTKNQRGKTKFKGYEKRRAAVCSNLTIKFHEGLARWLMKTMDNEEAKRSLEELESTLQYTGEMSLRLWSWKTFFEIPELPELKDGLFAVTSKDMELHALNLLNDEDYDSCGGMLVNVVVHAFVLGYGSSDGVDDKTPIRPR